MVKKMKIEKKVELLNKFVNGTLVISHYAMGWELSSYRTKSFFLYDKGNDRNVYGKKFGEVVEKAYKEMQKEKTRIKKEKKQNG